MPFLSDEGEHFPVGHLKCKISVSSPFKQVHMFDDIHASGLYIFFQFSHEFIKSIYYFDRIFRTRINKLRVNG